LTPALVVSILGLLLQLGVGIFVYGKLTERVSTHADILREHNQKFNALDAEQGRQWESLGRHGERISAVEARCQANHG